MKLDEAIENVRKAFAAETKARSEYDTLSSHERLARDAWEHASKTLSLAKLNLEAILRDSQ